MENIAELVSAKVGWNVTYIGMEDGRAQLAFDTDQVCPKGVTQRCRLGITLNNCYIEGGCIPAVDANVMNGVDVMSKSEEALAMRDQIYAVCYHAKELMEAQYRVCAKL